MQGTVEPETVQRDDWDTHWNQYAEAAEQNPAERMRFRLVVEYLALGTKPAKFLDIGSGQGDMIAIVSSKHPQAQALGVELSATGVDIAEQKVPTAKFHQRDLLESQPVPDEWAYWATHAVCSEVLEHVDDPVLLLKNARKFMAPGCRLVVTVPGGPRSAFDHHIGHRRHFSANDLRQLLVEAGFQRIQTFGAGFPFFNLYRLVVIARGKRLVQDVSAQEHEGSLSGSAKLVMRVFGVLFRFNMKRSKLGWQTVGLARNPE